MRHMIRNLEMAEPGMEGLVNFPLFGKGIEIFIHPGTPTRQNAKAANGPKPIRGFRLSSGPTLYSGAFNMFFRM